MGRTLKRVPLDFGWPQGEIWEGGDTIKRLSIRDGVVEDKEME